MVTSESGYYFAELSYLFVGAPTPVCARVCTHVRVPMYMHACTCVCVCTHACVCIVCFPFKSVNSRAVPTQHCFSLSPSLCHSKK